MESGKLLTYRSVCDYLDCSDDTVRRLVEKGLLKAPRQYQGLGLRFRSEDVMLYRYLEEAEQARADAAGEPRQEE